MINQWTVWFVYFFLLRRWFNLIIHKNNNTIFDILVNTIIWSLFFRRIKSRGCVIIKLKFSLSQLIWIGFGLDWAEGKYLVFKDIELQLGPGCLGPWATSLCLKNNFFFSFLFFVVICDIILYMYISVSQYFYSFYHTITMPLTLLIYRRKVYG